MVVAVVVVSPLAQEVREEMDEWGSWQWWAGHICLVRISRCQSSHKSSSPITDLGRVQPASWRSRCMGVAVVEVGVVEVVVVEAMEPMQDMGAVRVRLVALASHCPCVFLSRQARHIR